MKYTFCQNKFALYAKTYKIIQESKVFKYCSGCKDYVIITEVKKLLLFWLLYRS